MSNNENNIPYKWRRFFGSYECKLDNLRNIKFIYSEKATKFCEIFPLLLTAVHTVKSKGKIFQNFVAFSEHMNFKRWGNKNSTPCTAIIALKGKLKNSKIEGLLLLNVFFHTKVSMRSSILEAYKDMKISFSMFKFSNLLF